VALVLLKFPGVTPRLTADRFFEALDGCFLHAQGCECRVEVYGVFEDAGQRWIQLALETDSVQLVTLRLGPKQSPRHAVRSLASWFSHLTRSGEAMAHGAISALLAAALPPS
jgi:hypothetical protein